MDKRTYLKSAGILGIGTVIGHSGLAGLIESVSEISPARLAGDEKFWKQSA